MAQVEVSRLAMACKAQHSAAPRIRLEDALQSEVPDDDRLVLIRRMAISAGGSALRPGQRQQAMRSAWQNATDGARHGSDRGAPNANCVWFASEAEAEIVLLDLLLRGCVPVGWFWRLAVPNWRGRAVLDWLPEMVAAAILPGSEAQLVRLLACCAQHGANIALIAALQSVAEPGIALDAALERGNQDAEARAADVYRADLPGTVSAEVLRRFPGAVLKALAAVQVTQHGAPAIRAVLRAQALRVSPALAMRPMLLAEVTARAEQQLQAPSTVDAPAQTGRPPEMRKSDPAAARPSANPGERQGRTASSAGELATDLRTAVPDVASTNHDQQPVAAERANPIAPALVIGRALHSAHAGLWLVLPALADLGFRKWLQDRPGLLGDHPGAQLMRAIARHHGCAAEDPALSGLPQRDPGQPEPQWTGLWRHGLDRWLRRTARRRLHDLLRRPGKLLWSDDRVQITFPLAAADIRLRRLALDRDPGWTDWLGLSVRFAYSDEARG